MIGVTGWRGFVGSHLIKKIDNPVLFEGDLRILSRVKSFVKECDVIYHLAGLNRASEGHILNNNILATGNLLLACKIMDVSPEIVFLSSKQIEFNPNSEYSIAKQIEEDIIKKTKNWCIYRVPNVYGEGGKPFYNSVVATFAYQIAHKQTVTINNPEEVREFIYIDDLVEELLSPTFPSLFNVRGEQMSIGELYKKMKSEHGGRFTNIIEYWRHNEVPIARG